MRFLEWSDSQRPTTEGRWLKGWGEGEKGDSVHGTVSIPQDERIPEIGCTTM